MTSPTWSLHNAYSLSGCELLLKSDREPPDITWTVVISVFIIGVNSHVAWNSYSVQTCWSIDCGFVEMSSKDLTSDVQHVDLSSSGSPTVTSRCKAPVEHPHARNAMRGNWLPWLMRVFKTTPELLEARHSNPWFALFLALCFPSMVAGMMVRSTVQAAPHMYGSVLRLNFSYSSDF